MGLKLISVWRSSLLDAHTFVNQHGIVDRLVQVLPDDSVKSGGYWVLLRLSLTDLGDLLTVTRDERPRLTILGDGA